MLGALYIFAVPAPLTRRALQRTCGKCVKFGTPLKRIIDALPVYLRLLQKVGLTRVVTKRTYEKQSCLKHISGVKVENFLTIFYVTSESKIVFLKNIFFCHLFSLIHEAKQKGFSFRLHTHILDANSCSYPRPPPGHTCA